MKNAKTHFKAICCIGLLLCTNHSKEVESLKQRRLLNQERQKIPYNDLRIKYYIPNKFTNREIDSTIFISKRNEIPENIAFNLIYKESGFDSTANYKGCLGYTQLNKRYFTFKNRFDNIRQGFEFLKKQFDRLGTWENALIYYNSGEKMHRNNNYITYILNHGT